MLPPQIETTVAGVFVASSTYVFRKEKKGLGLSRFSLMRFQLLWSVLL